MALADRIKACRKNAGLSQAELAERLLVSRQAVTKWESGRGYPDIQNLKSMASLFDVSVDYLLDEDTAPMSSTMLRQPVDVASLEPYKQPGKPLGSRTHAAVKQVFPDATIHQLSRMHANNKFEEGIEWLLAFVFDTPFGMFDTADSLKNLDAYYLVEHKQRQLLVRVTKDAVISQEVSPAVTGRRFKIGQDRFFAFTKPI